MSPAEYENSSENCANPSFERHPAASGGVNESAPGTPIGTQLTQAGSRPVHARPEPIYQLDCKARRAADKADRMRIDLTKKMAEAVLVEGNDAVTPFLRRQMTDVMKPGEFPKPKHRVAAKTEVAL